MNMNEKLITLRHKKGLSQEQLADMMGVSRQAVSKWESGTAVPDMNKLIILADFYRVSVDTLVRDNVMLTEDGVKEISSQDPVQAVPILTHGSLYGYEYKSKRTLFGWPLVHINCGCGFRVAKGIFALGDVAIGAVSIGGVALGGIAIGGGSLGLLTLGGLSVGLVAFGGAAVGVLALGGAAFGVYALGGMAVASQIATGGFAIGTTAIGDTAIGVHALEITGQTYESIRAFLLKYHPNLWNPLLTLLSAFH